MFQKESFPGMFEYLPEAGPITGSFNRNKPWPNIGSFKSDLPTVIPNGRPNGEKYIMQGESSWLNMERISEQNVGR